MKNTFNKLVTNEKGQALPAVLILLVLGGLTIAPLLSHMSTGLNATRIHHEKMVEQYSADSGIDDASWRLLYEAGFAGFMTPEEPSVDYSININGMEVPITVTRLSGLGGETLSLDVNYTILADHRLEFMVTVISGGFCHFAYDTDTYSSGLIIPTTSGTITYYLHNNPTPPFEDTSAQENLPMDVTQPTATTLYNYDQWDNDPGRGIKKSGGGPGGLELEEYQNWWTTKYASETHLEGTVGISLWATPTGQSYGTDGSFRVFLRDYDDDPVSPTYKAYKEIASTDYDISKEQWVKDGWTPTAVEGKYRILASAGDTQIEATVGLGFGYLRILSFVYAGG